MTRFVTGGLRLRGRFATRFVRGRLRRMRGRVTACFGVQTGSEVRVPVVAVVALAAAAATMGMDTGPPAADRAVQRVSPVLPAQAIAVRISEVQPRATPRAAAEHYRRTSRRRVPRSTPTAFLPLYREAARRYGVNWRLLASIHRQETAFSTAESTYHGLNAFGCCAGPMQFNVTNGPVSTWKLYRQAFREGRRPKRYPHRTRHHPSIYDDFDAIMAAGWLLSDSGAGLSLDRSAWWAAYSYYGHDLFGVTYASQVLARAVAWRRDGFCPNCALDEGLVARFDARYGDPVRRALLADERAEKKKQKKKKKRRKRKVDRRDRERSARESQKRAPKRSRLRRPASRAEKKRPAQPAPPAQTQTVPAEPLPAAAPVPPPPPPKRCSPLEKLLGC